MNKKVTTFISSILLATGTIAVANTVKPAQQVQASKLSVLNHTTKFKEVRTTKDIFIRKIHWTVPIYKSKLGPEEILAKGSYVKILHSGTNFGWYVKLPTIKSDFTIVKGDQDTSWFTFNLNPPKKRKHKQVKPGFKGNTYYSKDGSHIKFDNIVKTHVVMTPNLDYETKSFRILALTGTFTNNGNKSISPSDWGSNYLDFITNSKDIDEYNDFEDGQSILEFMSFTLLDEKNTQYKKLIANSDKKIKPGKSIRFAIVQDMQTSPQPTYFKIEDFSTEKTITFKVQSGKRYTLK